VTKKKSLTKVGGWCIAQLAADKIRHKRVFPADDHHLPQLVNHWEYSDEIASYFGAKPDLVRWFFRNPFKYVPTLPDAPAPWHRTSTSSHLRART
jgi:hypothetical protein